MSSFGEKAGVFLVTPEHPCAYLPDRTACTVYFQPTGDMAASYYDQLAPQGFRRSGEHVYRPACPACNACVPARIPVAEFRPSRSQRRTLKRNQGFEIAVRDAAYDPVHFALYQKYLQARHPDGDMAANSPADYQNFLITHWVNTEFIEIHRSGSLLAVAVTDRLDQALSATYTFFDPDRADLAPGIISILVQIERARALGLNWLYLGYWIEESPKMRYKKDFHPIEILRSGRWQPLET